MTLPAKPTNPKQSPLRQLFGLAAIVWTAVAVATLTMELSDQRNFVAANALSIARAGFEKDIAFRRWAAKHGGVYVPVTEETPPNPYLEIPEREIRTPSGQLLTRMNPAYMSRQLYENSRSSAGSPHGHITSLNPIRPENAPDPWERKALESFEKGGSEFSGFQTLSGAKYFRYMHALNTEKPCLKCHAAQGYREGDIRGGISVSVPMAMLDNSMARSDRFHALIIVAVWLSGIAGLWFGFRNVNASSRALLESEERYRRQFQESKAVMLIVNPENGGIEDTNPAACGFYGFSREKICTMTVFDINCGARENVMQRLIDAKNGIVGRSQFRHLLADGRVRDVEVFSSPFHSHGTVRLHSIVIDITSQVAAERQLREKMGFAENLIYNSTAPTFVIGADHRVLIWNRALEELSGSSASDVIGTNEQWRPFYPSPRPTLADIVIDDKVEEALQLYPHLQRSRLIPDGLHSEGDYILGNRKRHLVYSSAPIRDNDGRIVAAIETVEDITERLSLEAQLLQSQKMESVGIMAGGIAHDFNNVLTVINGYADLLQLTLPENDENRYIAREISASVDRAAEMTHSLLAFSGKHDMLLQHDDLNHILNTIRKSLTRLIREDIILAIQPCEEILPVYVDRVQIEQVLINLVVNARDAVGNGGRITVSTAPSRFDETVILGNTVIPPGQYGCLCVRDSGSGIDPAMLDRIFQPFFTTKEKDKGTGLGLSIVQSIVARHNGYVTVASTPGKGTEFSIYLQNHEGGQSVKQAEPLRSVDLHGSETVLIVDDDAAITGLLRDLLEHYGYSILAAGDGVEALELLETHRESIRIVISDVIMPRMNGRELVENIRKRLPELPIIMSSGYADDIVDRAAFDELKVVFLQKPLKPLDVLTAIRIGLQQE